MIEESALVVSVEGGLAEVETRRRSACGDCTQKAGCGSALLAGLFGNRPSRMWVMNRAGARPGERVVLGVPEAALMRAAFALYGVPVAALIAGALAGDWLGGRLVIDAGELPSLLGGLLGLIAGLTWLRRFAVRTRTDTTYRAVVLRRESGDGVPVVFR